METESSLRKKSLGILSDIALHKLVMLSRLVSRDLKGKSDSAPEGGFVDDIAVGANNTTPRGLVYDASIAGRMLKRGWMPEQIDEAVTYGEKFPVINIETSAVVTRYVHAPTKRSVVVNPVTNEILHIGKWGFKYPANNGFMPGVTPIAIVGNPNGNVTPIGSDNQPVTGDSPVA